MTRKDYDIALDDGLELYDKALEDALDDMDKDGLELTPDRPKTRDGSYFDGRLPANLTSLDMRDLGDLFTHMTIYAGYVRGLLTVSKAEFHTADEKLRLAKSKVRKSKLGNKADKDDDTIIDSRYANENYNFLRSKTRRDLLEGIDSTTSTNIRVISRQIEVKKLEFDQGRGRSGGSEGGGGRGRKRLRVKK